MYQKLFLVGVMLGGSLLAVKEGSVKKLPPIVVKPPVLPAETKPSEPRHTWHRVAATDSATLKIFGEGCLIRQQRPAFQVTPKPFLAPGRAVLRLPVLK